MAAFRDDMPLVAGVNEDWDEDTTCAQIVRPDWDFSPIRMQTMHHIYSSTCCAQRDLIARSLYQVVSRLRAIESSLWISTATNHAVCQLATSCQRKVLRYA